MYIVEGNIGVGKSTFLQLAEERLAHVTTVQEPKDSWVKQEEGKSLLSKFYADPKRWSYTIETLVMVCRARDHLKHQKRSDSLQLLERSIYSGHYCFALNGYNLGYFSDFEWELYSNMVDFFLKEQCQLPKGFVYLRADPEVTFDRIQKRGRPSERGLSLEYERQIHQLHDDFLIEKKGIFKALSEIPVLVLDCNEDFVESPARLESHLEKFRLFVEEQAPLVMPAVKSDEKFTQKT